LIREEIRELPDCDFVMIATGPLTSDGFSKTLKELAGREFLYFYDAVSPILSGSSVEMKDAFWGARYEPQSKDYLNLPMTQDEYCRFVDELQNAGVTPLNKPDEGLFFESCLPIEEAARSGRDTLAFGPMKPVGFKDCRVKKDFYAVVQLRREDIKGTMFNIVGFQTRMKVPEQKRVFGLIPGLKNAEFLRFGKMHRNTYINSRKLLNRDLGLKNRKNVYFSGQLTGVEGYLESAASGLLGSLYMLSNVVNADLPILTTKTMIGSLIDYVTNNEYDYRNFQPMNANFGIIRGSYGDLKMRKNQIKSYIYERAIEEMKSWSELVPREC
jgi:methylenetetrahydrofolate--tRNA-(uracil-5-)-methyltransferase